MNETQVEIIGFIFGLFFAFSEEDIFLKYLAPIILKDSASALNPLLSFVIGVIGILTILASFLILYKIFKNIEWVRTNRPKIFQKFLAKIIITAILSTIIFYYLSLKVV